MHDADDFVFADADEIGQGGREGCFIIGNQHAHNGKQEKISCLRDKFCHAPTDALRPTPAHPGGCNEVNAFGRVNLPRALEWIRDLRRGKLAAGR